MILLGWFTALIYINRVPVLLGSVWIRFGTVMETVTRKWVPYRKNGTQARYGGVWEPVLLPFLVQATVNSVIKNSGLFSKFPTTHSFVKTRGSVRRYGSEVGYGTVTTDSGFVFKFLTTHFVFVRTRGSVRMYESEVGYGTVIYPKLLCINKHTPHPNFKYEKGKSGRKCSKEKT